MVASRAGAPDGVLAEAVRRLVEALAPERIYLFGSRARGDATDDSDYDFLVVVPEVELPRGEQERRAYRALADLGVAKDVLVQTSASFERNRPVVGSFVAAIEREGRLLYGHAPPREVPDPMEVEQQKATLTREWLERAERDLGAADRALMEPPLFDMGVYHCQQAYEKALEGFLTWHDRPLRKTHVLPDLLRECEQIDPGFARFVDPAEIVSPYAWKFRYPHVNEDGELISIEPSGEDAAEALRFAREVFDFVAARLPAAARPVRRS